MSSPKPERYDQFTRGEIALFLGILFFALKGTQTVNREAQAIAEFYGIPYSWANEVVKTAAQLGTNPWWLAAVISLESTWQLAPRNETTNATG